MNRKQSAVSTKRVPSATTRSGTVLQEIFARKRETEQLRSEKNSAVAQYYDKWGRITSRFENWTTPEYYEKSEQMLRKDEEEKRKKEEIEQRRERMRDLRAKEKEEWERELKEQQRNKMRPGSAASTNSKRDVDVLQRLNSALSEQERRRKEIESKLYSRWRFGMTRDDLMLESKNHHQAMAKLNWLDQQVEEQLERDRAKKEWEALEMQRQSEQLREEEVALEARKSREREVAELKKLLEFHVMELKARESESRRLKEQNGTLEDVKVNLELKQQEMKSIFSQRGLKDIPMHNLRRLKVLIQSHCKDIQEEIVQDAAQIPAIKGMMRGQLLDVKEEKHIQLLECKFEQELVELQQAVENIMAMYDSEVKGELIKQQKIWKENADTRFRLLKNVLQELMDKCAIILGCNTEEMASLIKIKESHLKSIEDLSEKLRELTGDSPARVSGSMKATDFPKPATSVIKPTQQSFVSLGEQLEGLRLASDSFVPSEKLNGTPRFGRKKMAWC